ncbi:hypothetical protein MTsPCn9_15190 [Croceitalea sp. MTPC9]|nr:hypothetical protein MTsPCn6_13940 [Croceitalea sp. MTPC6]GMN16583.1 hypothetical protein MTsPCn9_15190 [Croceitalea sp. MTPC9]
MISFRENRILWPVLFKKSMLSTNATTIKMELMKLLQGKNAIERPRT